MPIQNGHLLRLALGVAIWSAALSASAAIIFGELRQGQGHTIEIIRQGKVVTSVTVPPAAVLQVDANSVSHDKEKRISTFRGRVIAKVKLASEVVFSISADEIRVLDGELAACAPVCSLSQGSFSWRPFCCWESCSRRTIPRSYRFFFSSSPCPQLWPCCSSGGSCDAVRRPGR